jgi:tetratricopeptide (TPR) repeat protein
MNRTLVASLCAASALLALALPARAQTTAADSAWERKDTDLAERLYSQRLAADSSDVMALRRIALLRAWAGKYGESIALYDRAVRLAPADELIALERARVLAWNKEYTRAIAALDEILARSPRSRPALEARAQFTSWSGRYGESVATYNKLLEETPGDPEALRGLARVASWRGDLAEGERRWRKVLAASPDDVAALVGLAAVLRWQGRDSAALPLLEEAIRLSPRDRDARTQLEWVRAAVAPRATPSLVYETDSDGNRIMTTSLVGAWRPAPRLEIRGAGYLRRAEQTGAESFAQQGSGALISAWRQWEPGWALTLGVGVRLSDTPGADPLPSARAVLTTPARNAGSGSVAFNRNALDATAALLRNRVSVDELAASASTTLGAGWNLSGGASAAVYDGRETNIRTGGYASLARRMLPRVTLGVAARAFGFEKDLNEGYFDPDFYGIAEITASVYQEVRKWNLGTEIAPGLQQVGSNGKRTGAFRATGRIGYTVAPGRQVGVSAGLSNSGLHQLSPGSDADYRYRAFSVSGGWRF